MICMDKYLMSAPLLGMAKSLFSFYVYIIDVFNGGNNENFLKAKKKKV